MLFSNTTQLIRFPEVICEILRFYDATNVDDIIMWNKFFGTHRFADKVQNEKSKPTNSNPFLKYITFWAAWRMSTKHIILFLWKMVYRRNKNKQSKRDNRISQKINKTKIMPSFGNKNCIHSSFNQILVRFSLTLPNHWITQSPNIISEQSWFITWIRFENE